MTTYNIAVCLYGFNRYSKSLRNLSNFFKNYFENAEISLYIYYALYDTQTEFGGDKINESVIYESLRRHNPEVVDIKLSAVTYSELDCLKEIKTTGARHVKNNVKKVFLHREYSMYCSMKRCFDMIDSNIRHDYVCISRLDWGMNEIEKCKKVDVVKLLAPADVGIVAGHLNGNLNEKNLSTDPRFIFGRYDDMRFISDLPELFLEHVRERKQEGNVDRVMHVHGFISYVIVNLLKYKVLSQHVMFGSIVHLSVKVTQNKEINFNANEENRIRALYNTL